MSVCFDLYMKEVEKIPLLSLEEEKMLICEANNGSRSAQEKLVNANLRFVISMANKFKGYGVPVDDLINAGNIGLIEAARKINPSYKVKFISYAMWWIRDEMQNAVRNNAGFKFPANKFDEMKKEKYRVSSLYSPLAEEEGCVMDLLSDEKNKQPDVEVLDGMSVNEVRQALKCLNEKERKVIEMRFGFGKNDILSLNEVGKKVGMTKEGVRLLECRALKKMKQSLGKDFCCMVA